MEFRASRAEITGGSIFWFVCIAAAPVVVMAIRVIYWFLSLAGEFVPVFGWFTHWVDGDLAFLLVGMPLVVLCGFWAEWRRYWAAKRKRDGSWCRLTPAGVEYCEPGKYCNFRWSEIDSLWSTFDTSTGEDTFDVIEVRAGRQKFRMSARFFTEEEVKLVEGLCRLRSGIE